MSVITGERGGKGVSFEEEEKKGVLRVLQGGCHFGWKFFMDLPRYHQDTRYYYF